METVMRKKSLYALSTSSPPNLFYLNVTLQVHSTENDTMYTITIPGRDNEHIDTGTTIH